MAVFTRALPQVGADAVICSCFAFLKAFQCFTTALSEGAALAALDVVDPDPRRSDAWLAESPLSGRSEALLEARMMIFLATLGLSGSLTLLAAAAAAVAFFGAGGGAAAAATFTLVGVRRIGAAGFASVAKRAAFSVRILSSSDCRSSSRRFKAMRASILRLWLELL